MADLSSLTSSFSLESIRGGFYEFGQYIIWGVLLMGVAIFSWLKYQDKKVFIYPVRINRQRNNGQVKEQNCMGGYVKRGSITKFVIKMGKFKKKELDRLPDSKYMDEDNRVYYWQTSPDSPLIQVKREFIVEPIVVEKDKIKLSNEEKNLRIENICKELKNTEEYKDSTEEELKEISTRLIEQEIEESGYDTLDIKKTVYSPVPSDLKQQCMSEISEYSKILGVDTNKQMAYFIIGAIILAVFGVIIFYIAMNKGDVPILTK